MGFKEELKEGNELLEQRLSLLGEVKELFSSVSVIAQEIRETPRSSTQQIGIGQLSSEGIDKSLFELREMLQALPEEITEEAARVTASAGSGGSSSNTFGFTAGEITGILATVSAVMGAGTGNQPGPPRFQPAAYARTFLNFSGVNQRGAFF